MATVLRFDGSGLAATAEVVGQSTVPLSEDERAAAAKRTSSAERAECAADAPATTLPKATAVLSTLAVKLLSELLDAAPERETIAVGVHGVGLWHTDHGFPAGYRSLVDAALLAEGTGLTAVDEFPARDLAQGGRGGPLDLLPLWLLYRDLRRSRLLVHLGSSLRLTYVPASWGDNGAERATTIQLGLGCDLVEAIAVGSDGPAEEQGADFPQAGKCVDALREKLLERCCSWEAFSAWHPYGCSQEPLLETVRAFVEAMDCSRADALCTACSVMAEMVADAVHHRVPKSPPLHEVIFLGADDADSCLTQSICARLDKLQQIAPEKLPVPPRLAPAAIAAVLAYLHFEQVPLGGPLSTGAPAPRLLGTLTPGAPRNWQRAVQYLATGQPKKLTLQSAI